MYPETLTTNDKANKLKIKSIYLELNMTFNFTKIIYVHGNKSNSTWGFEKS